MRMTPRRRTRRAGQGCLVVVLVRMSITTIRPRRSRIGCRCRFKRIAKGPIFAQSKGQAGHGMRHVWYRGGMNFQLQAGNGGIDLDGQNFAVMLFPALKCHVNLQWATAGIAESAGQNGNGW